MFFKGNRGATEACRFGRDGLDPRRDRHRKGAGRAVRFTTSATGRATRSWRSIAARSPTRCSRPNCSGTSEARSRTHTPGASASSRRPALGPSSSTSSTHCRSRRKSRCSASFRNAGIDLSARPRRSRQGAGSWPRRTRTLTSSSGRPGSVPTCIIESAYLPSRSPRCENAATIFSASPPISSRSIRPMACLSPGSRRRRVAALLSADWPGNVRELENAIIRGSQLRQSDVIEAADLGLSVDLPVAAPAAESPGPMTRGSYRELKQQMIEEFERQYLTGLMREHGGNVSRAARHAGKERRELGKLLKKHRLDPRQFATGTPTGVG